MNISRGKDHRELVLRPVCCRPISCKVHDLKDRTSGTEYCSGHHFVHIRFPVDQSTDDRQQYCASPSLRNMFKCPIRHPIAYSMQLETRRGNVAKVKETSDQSWQTRRLHTQFPVSDDEDNNNNNNRTTKEVRIDFRSGRNLHAGRTSRQNTDRHLLFHQSRCFS